MGKLWEVIGGADKGGILVRRGGNMGFFRAVSGDFAEETKQAKLVGSGWW